MSFFTDIKEFLKKKYMEAQKTKASLTHPEQKEPCWDITIPDFRSCYRVY